MSSTHCVDVLKLELQIDIYARCVDAIGTRVAPLRARSPIHSRLMSKTPRSERPSPPVDVALVPLVLAGAAGLKLGAALIAPGRLTRKQALVAAGRAAAGIMYGVAAMLFAAAFVEAFWSPRTFAPHIKYAVGAAMWLAVLAYFAYAGRARGA